MTRRLARIPPLAPAHSRARDVCLRDAAGPAHHQDPARRARAARGGAVRPLGFDNEAMALVQPTGRIVAPCCQGERPAANVLVISERQPVRWIRDLSWTDRM